jgi:type II secretory pathway predicted ATPase ExeA
MDNAVETIVLAAKGVPRVINNVALKSMTLAVNEKMTTVDQTCVLKALEELGLR